MLISKEFHIFVIITTIIYFILLRRYKQDITNNALSKDNNKKEPSNLIYIIFLPIVLYLGHIFLNMKSLNKPSLNTNSSIMQPAYNVYKPPSSEGLLSAPYPAS